jgi:putative transposase
LKDVWTEPDTRDQVIDFVRLWSEKTEILIRRFITWLDVSRSKFYSWRDRYGQVNEHNNWLPRDSWLEEWEKKAIIEFYKDHRQDGYRRVCYMMLDDNIVAVSPSSVYRVLNKAGMLRKWNQKKSTKGTGFSPPEKAHDHWHIDLSYLNICGTFYYLCSVLDGYSRSIVHWEIRESMTETDVEIVLQRALEKQPKEKPRVISDNGPQFIAKDFKQFICLAGMTHVRTSPYYPQSNGKIERWHQSLKKECLRPKTPLNLDDAKRLVANFVDYYNNKRLHSALGYITPKDKLEGRENQIFAQRDRKLEAARQTRKQKRLNEKLIDQANAELAMMYG